MGRTRCGAPGTNTGAAPSQLPSAVSPNRSNANGSGSPIRSMRVAATMMPLPSHTSSSW